MDRLQAMQTLVRVVELGSFSAAARELGSTQSAVSKQVAALEKALGAQLLARSTRALKLTDAGERYVEQARRLVAEVAEAESELRAGEHRLQGWLRVAASGTFGRMKLVPLVRSFQAAHPGVKVDLQLHDGFVDLIEQGIDIAVRVGEQPDSSLVARRIGTVRRCVVARRGYFETLGMAPPREPADLPRHNCIVYSELRAGPVWSFEAGPGASAPPGSEVSVRVAGSLRTNSGEAVREAVLAGMGLAYAPGWLFETEVARGDVQFAMPNWLGRALPMQLVSPPQRRSSGKVRAFGDHLAAGLA
ncbi:DNA-binding transcriptional LysR family regulator [Pelomonas aquatica]|uniref:DNA-binding transcriptional LysR family regulator n=1 Tax=Pelomonas aquatica TaxID=431058 RepID=A0ABU1Z813_9BURK|nr:LysR family transcriptional regulator [Pelomonas aquatica]MDR7296757.1 DNA-binding transcriptional LysR family regulator [Pelomonas aquatica]